MDELEDIFTDEDKVVSSSESVVENEDVFNEDDFLVPTPEIPETGTIIDSFLKAKGIDASKINIVDEDGTEREVSFNDLTSEEQLDLLLSSEESPENNELDDTEIELINYLRTNNLTFEELLENYKNAILAEFADSQPVTTGVDAYDDKELFLLDLKTKFELTDEELEIELEKELKNEELFKKKVSKLREDYKKLEEAEQTRRAQELADNRQKDYDKLVGTMVETATAIEDFHGIVLEDEEKQQTLSYLLQLDESGTSQFTKDLGDPKKLYEAAWYLKYGKEAFQVMASAYEAEIAKLKKPDKPRVVVRNTQEIKDINDLNI